MMISHTVGREGYMIAGCPVTVLF